MAAGPASLRCRKLCKATRSLFTTSYDANWQGLRPVTPTSKSGTNVFSTCVCPVDCPPRPRVARPAHSREAASYIAHGERYSANHGVKAFLAPFTRPDATGRGRTRVPVRLRTTRTRACARRSKPSSRDGAASASGVRPAKRTKIPVIPWFAEYRSPWAINDAAPRLCAGDFHARLGRQLHRFPCPVATMLFSTHKRDVNPPAMPYFERGPPT